MKSFSTTLGLSLVAGGALALVVAGGCGGETDSSSSSTSGTGGTAGTGGIGGTGGTAGSGGTQAGGGGAGGIAFNDPSKTPTGNIAPGDADFVGHYTSAPGCSTCHPGKITEWEATAHGLDFTNVHGMDLIYGFGGTAPPDPNAAGGACAPCHSVGFQESTGFDAVTPAHDYLEGVGCEECHGPGGNHSGNKANINRIPDAQVTCWHCHVSSYKQTENSPLPTTDADLSGTNPGSVTVHHPQAIMLNGMVGYEYSGSTYESSSHTNIANSCVTCHLYATATTVPHGAGALDPDIEACRSCHTDATDVATLIKSQQDEIKQLLITLGGEDPNTAGMPDPDVGGGLLNDWATANSIVLDANPAPTDPQVMAYKAARHNYEYGLNDASYGIHNYKYVKQLLDDSIAAVTP